MEFTAHVERTAKSNPAVLMTDMNRMCDSAGRGCRVNTSYRSMPQMNFDSGLNTRGMGRSNLNGQRIDGQYIPDRHMSFVNNRGNTGRTGYRRGNTGRFR